MSQSETITRPTLPIKDTVQKGPLKTDCCSAVFRQIGNERKTHWQNWEGLQRLSKTSTEKSKNEAQAIAPQMSGMKTKEAVLEHNLMSMCWADLDTGDRSKDDILASLGAIGITSAIVYSYFLQAI